MIQYNTVQDRPYPQYRFLDVMRGLAALGVVLFHLGAPRGAPHILTTLFGYGGVGPFIFFVISGYVIYQAVERQSHEGSRGALTFLRKRVRRIYPAFLMSLPLAFIVPVLGRHISYSIPQVLSIATLTYLPLHIQPPQSVYWTLVIEQQFYIVMALLLLIPIAWRYRMPLLILSAIPAGLLAHGMGNTSLVMATLPGY